MNNKLIFAAILGLGVAAAPAAMAKSNQGHGHGQDKSHHDQKRDHDGWKGQREQHWHGDRYTVVTYKKPQGYKHRDWHHGDRLPVVYQSSRYVVNDYHSYRLQAPPRGHHWVRVDNDVVLTAVTTGVIAAVVYGIFQ